MENSGEHILLGFLVIFLLFKIYSCIFNCHTYHCFTEKGEVHSDHYKLLPIDLRDIDQLNDVLAIAGMDPRYESIEDFPPRGPVFKSALNNLNYLVDHLCHLRLYLNLHYCFNSVLFHSRELFF